MRAFLSHSSMDKAYVEAVAEGLRPGHYELDTQTFERGDLNAEAILSALARSDLFVLFLSRNSIESGYVDFEVAFGRELVARGAIGQVLTICLDEYSFNKASTFIKHYNMIRKPVSADSASRHIEGVLLSSRYSKEALSHPFVGRENELKILEQQANDLNSPRIKALFISGNPGVGRRRVARKFYQNYYPNVGVIVPEIELESFEGYDDIFRSVLAALRPAISISELRESVVDFSILNDEGKAKRIADEINSLLDSREVLYVVDSGGLLRDSGEMQPEFDAILKYINSKPHPPLVFISPRMTPNNKRRASGDIAYCSVPNLSRDETERLIITLLRDKDIKANSEQISDLVNIADQHPFNIYRMMTEIERVSLGIFLANPRDFIDWKHKQTSEYIRSAQLGRIEIKILSIFSIAPVLDFHSLTGVISDELRSDVADSIQKMADLHIVQVEDDNISVSPALRIAADRDPRTDLKGPERTRIMKALADSLVLRLEEGDAPITLLGSAVMASLDSDEPVGKLVEAFILPSHQVWLAKRHYDSKRWKESMRMAREAISGKQRLSKSGAVAACRYLGLAAARINDQQAFEEGLSELKKVADDDWSRSNVWFLEGFNLRLQGKLQEAREKLINSYGLARRNRSTSRELASVCLNLDLPAEAEGYAREAYENAKWNPYIIDILISCLIKNKGRGCVRDPEVDDLLDKLEQRDAEEGRSFHKTRMAEIELLYGDTAKALILIQDAIKTTPRLFEPLRLYVKILLKIGNHLKAKEQLDIIRDATINGDHHDRRANYRPYLQLLSDYYLGVGDFEKALDVYDDSRFFTDEDRRSIKKEVDMLRAYK